ncbi:MAG: hypothetical protein ACD_21C00303G0003 [uncultured bacterium]|nr:MAG: hypothetical protein ACD_21C00303G0003 [uncultured bacterium]
MTTKKGAQLLVECLVKHKVEYIFGIPGAKIDAVFDALLDSPIRLILCRHEQNAAFMAAAYGRITGKPGVVLVTSGPGVSNLTTGLLTATTEGDPVVAIGGNVARNMQLKESHQQADNIKLMEAVTKAQKEVMLAENIPEIVENAFRIATMPRAGAVFISVPQDVLSEKTEVTFNQLAAPIVYGSAQHLTIAQVADLINKAKQPVLFLGVEASRAENAAAIRNLLQQKKMATIGTYQAAGVVSRELLDCFMGRVGLFKNQPGDALLDAADVVVTVGFDSVEYDPEIWNANQKKTIIHFDYNPADIHLSYSPAIEVIGDIATNINELIPLLQKRDLVHNIPLVHELHQKLKNIISSGANITGDRIHPLRFLHDLRNNIDDDVTVVSDIGTHYMWIARYFFCFNPRHLLFSNGQQTLGVALPWAMAASLVRSGKQIISISGDGGFLFSANELETAVREKMHFVHFVWCDGSYDMVKQQQLIKYKRTCGVNFGYVDIVKYAESFGATGFRIEHADEIVRVLNKALNTEGPVLVEVPIDYSDNHKLFEDSRE